MKQEILNLIDQKNIRIVFQPIISLRSAEVYGYEALSRGPKDSNFENPEILFKKAYEHNLVWELEYLCRSKALERFSNIETEAKLFLNVNPNIMHDAKFKQGFTKEYLNKFNVDASKIVFEITEREAIYNALDFINTVEHYKGQDYNIAIDDAGSGYSGLNLISEVYPHFIKLDMKLIRNVDKDFIKQALVKSMCEYANLTNTYLIAEGIETEEELRKLIDMGVHYGQGYFIKKPAEDISSIESDAADVIKDSNRKKNHYFGKSISEFYVENITRNLRAINSNLRVSQIEDMMKHDASIPGYCVLEEEDIVGIITQNELYKHLSSLYGYNLYGNKPVKDIMSKDFLGVDYKSTIDVVAKRAMNREVDKIYDFIVVTKENKYKGIVTVKDLLEKSIEIEVMNAKNRKGVEECFPLISLSIACLYNRNFSSVYELGEAATSLKKKCKQLEGSNYLIV